MRFSGKSIFSRGALYSFNEWTDSHECLRNSKEIQFAGYQEAIFVKNWFRKIFFRPLKQKKNKAKIRFFFKRLPFCYPGDFQKTKNDKAFLIESSLIIFNPFLFQMNWQGCGAPRADQNTPCFIWRELKPPFWIFFL